MLRGIPGLIIVGAILIISLMVIGCSGNNTPLEPAADNSAVSPQEGTDAGTMLWGVWNVVVDTETEAVEITELRTADECLNILGFLEPPPLANMNITNLQTFPAQNRLTMNLSLTHPLQANGAFTSFDIKGVVFGPDVVNADGYTRWMNPGDFSNIPYGYIDGLLGTPDSTGNYGSQDWGYKYFADGLGAYADLTTFFSNSTNLNNRGKFREGGTNTRYYELDFKTPSQFLVFNYAIVANYGWPTGSAPYTVSDFPVATANSAEAFNCQVTELGGSYYYNTSAGGSGSVDFEVELWDWQGDISDVTIESLVPGIVPKTSFDVYVGQGSTSRSYIYQFNNVAGTPTATGNLDLVITAVDPKTFGQCWFLGQLNSSHSMYNQYVYSSYTHTTNVISCPAPTSIDGIYPEGGYADDTSRSYTITGTGFIDGSWLAVALVKTGETRIDASNVVFVSDTTITCDITIPSGTTTGKRDIEVTNGCGTSGLGNDKFPIYGPVIWNPNIAITDGHTKCRATSISPIPDGAGNTTYWTSTAFGIAGLGPTGGNGGPYTYQYYISTSSSSATGSTVGWVAMSSPFAVTVQWSAYTSMAPDRLWLWVRASDGYAYSAPAACPTSMTLSRVVWQSANGSTLSRWASGSVYWIVGTNWCRAYTNDNSHGKGEQKLYRYDNWGSSGNNTFEYYLSNVSYSAPFYPHKVYARCGWHPTSTDISNTLLTWRSTGDGLRSHTITGQTGNRYYGYYFRDTYDYYNDWWDHYHGWQSSTMRYFAMYENPV